MNKPLTVERQEFANKIVDAINSTPLHAFIKSEILKNCVRELDALAAKEYEAELKMWTEAADAEE